MSSITLGNILDLLDCHRDSTEEVILVDEDGKYAMQAPVCSPYWQPFENRQVEAIEAEGHRKLLVWLSH